MRFEAQGEIGVLGGVFGCLLDGDDPTVRVARGYGNFQEAYFIRGFAAESDDTMYNGLYGILPRQYIATELFERVEVQRGASAFLNEEGPALAVTRALKDAGLNPEDVDYVNAHGTSTPIP